MATPAATIDTPPKKPTPLTKEQRERVLRGESPNPVETPEQKATRELAEKADREKKEKETKDKADREAKEKEDRQKKKEKADLPPIPPASSAPVTGDEVRRLAEETARATTLDLAKKNEPAAPKLNDDDQRDLELAEFAAKKHKDRYSDLPKKIVEFATRRDDYLATKAKELGGRETAEFRDFVTGDEFKRFMRENAPTYQRGDAKKIYEEFLEERGAQRALSTIEPKLEEMNRRQRQIEMAPVIQNTVANAVRIMLVEEGPQADESLVEFAKSPQAFVKENEVEGAIIVRHATFFQQAMEETMRITSGLATAAELQNPTDTQKWIDQFIIRKEREIETKFPNGALVEDGTIIVSSAQLDRLRKANVPNLSKYRMMKPNEIVGAIAVEGRAELRNQLDAERKRLERAGFQRVKKKETPPKTEETPTSGAENSPMAGSSPAAGASGGQGGGNAPAKPYWMKYVDGKTKQ